MGEAPLYLEYSREVTHVRLVLQGYLAHKKTPTSLRNPYGPGYGSTMVLGGGVFLWARCPCTPNTVERSHTPGSSVKVNPGRLLVQSTG